MGFEGLCFFKCQTLGLLGHPVYYHCHFHYLDFQGLIFVVVLVQAVGLVVVFEFVGIVCRLLTLMSLWLL